MEDDAMEDRKSTVPSLTRRYASMKILGDTFMIGVLSLCSGALLFGITVHQEFDEHVRAYDEAEWLTGFLVVSVILLLISVTCTAPTFVRFIKYASSRRWLKLEWKRITDASWKTEKEAIQTQLHKIAKGVASNPEMKDRFYRARDVATELIHGCIGSARWKVDGARIRDYV